MHDRLVLFPLVIRRMPFHLADVLLRQLHRTFDRTAQTFLVIVVHIIVASRYQAPSHARFVVGKRRIDNVYVRYEDRSISAMTLRLTFDRDSLVTDCAQ